MRCADHPAERGLARTKPEARLGPPSEIAKQPGQPLARRGNYGRSCRRARGCARAAQRRLAWRRARLRGASSQRALASRRRRSPPSGDRFAWAPPVVEEERERIAFANVGGSGVGDAGTREAHASAFRDMLEAYMVGGEQLGNRRRGLACLVELATLGERPQLLDEVDRRAGPPRGVAGNQAHHQLRQRARDVALALMQGARLLARLAGRERQPASRSSASKTSPMVPLPSAAPKRSRPRTTVPVATALFMTVGSSPQAKHVGARRPQRCGIPQGAYRWRESSATPLIAARSSQGAPPFSAVSACSPCRSSSLRRTHRARSCATRRLPLRLRSGR